MDSIKSLEVKIMNKTEELTKDNFYRCVHLELTLAITSMLYEKLVEAPQKEVPDELNFSMISNIVMVIEERLQELYEVMKTLPE